MTDTIAPHTTAITGVNGFVGQHLARELKQSGHKLIGIGRQASPSPEIKHLLENYISIDLAESWPADLMVDSVIHLAGLAVPGESFARPQDYIGVNSAIMTNMAECYLKQTQQPRLLIVSSGALYDPSQPMPLTEASAVDFSSPYAVSKALVENQCSYYRKRGLDCIVVRPFNHIGPGQTEGFLIPDVISQLKKSGSITVGNIATKRDFTDVRDIVRAYRLLATTPVLHHKLYNACSGISRSGSEVVDMLKQVMGKPEAKVVIDQSKVRPTDPMEIYGDASRLATDTGWKPQIDLSTTLEDCVKAS